MKFYVLVALSLLFQPILMTASDATKQDFKVSIQQAEAKTNIFALSSFAMKAKIRVISKGKPLEGSYLLFWNGPEQWREEISLPGYEEIQVGGKGVVFVKRSTDFLPLPIYQLHAALGYGSLGNGSGVTRTSLFYGAVEPDETIKKVRDQKINGLKVECAQIADQHGFTREACVDPPTGTLVRQEPFLDREQIAVGAKSFPRFLSYVEKGNPLAEVEVTDLQTPVQRSSSAFEPPLDAVSQPGCMNPTPFHLLNRIPPHYPEQERQSHVEGSVAIAATIGKDGIPRRLRVVSGATPRLNTASVDAVQQWRWEPSTCNGAAVDVETVVTINYRLE
jgi:TonB family protein